MFSLATVATERLVLTVCSKMTNFIAIKAFNFVPDYIVKALLFELSSDSIPLIQATAQVSILHIHDRQQCLQSFRTHSSEHEALLIVLLQQFNVLFLI